MGNCCQYRLLECNWYLHSEPKDQCLELTFFFFWQLCRVLAVKLHRNHCGKHSILVGIIFGHMRYKKQKITRYSNEPVWLFGFCTCTISNHFLKGGCGKCIYLHCTLYENMLDWMINWTSIHKKYQHICLMILAWEIGNHQSTTRDDMVEKIWKRNRWDDKGKDLTSTGSEEI